MPRCVTKNVPLARYTTLGIGGEAEYFARVTSEAELVEVLIWAKENGLRTNVLGGGSNVLVADTGVKGVILHMNIKGISYAEKNGSTVHVKAAGGEKWNDVVEAVTERGLWGIENLSGIPGTVGATPVQNINAYGTSIGDVLVSVTAYHEETGIQRIFTNAECGLEYRGSFFKTPEGKRFIITEVGMQLSSVKAVQATYRSSSQSIARWLEEKGITEPTATEMREAVLAVRRNIGMLEGIYRSAGSFFKNTVVSGELFQNIERVVAEQHAPKNELFFPWHWKLPDGREKISTAFLMECTEFNKTDFKDKLFNGSVGISPLHTLSIINVQDGTARDVEEFVRAITDAVFKEFGVQIEKEVCCLN